MMQIHECEKMEFSKDFSLAALKNPQNAVYSRTKGQNIRVRVYGALVMNKKHSVVLFLENDQH